MTQKSKKIILVLDDEPASSQAVTDRLKFLYQQDGFAFTPSFDVARQILRTQQVSCMSLDMLMPMNPELMRYNNEKVTGLNALRELREDYPSLPIAVYTVLEEESMNFDISKYGVEYICKTDPDAFHRLFAFFKRHA
jgi:CheY-like chemotaxis protein